MAWRDSRTHRKRLFFFTTAIVLGISAMVSIGSFGETLNQAIDDQAKTLMGADLMLESFQPFSERTAALIDSLGGGASSRNSFSFNGFFPEVRRQPIDPGAGH